MRTSILSKDQSVSPASYYNIEVVDPNTGQTYRAQLGSLPGAGGNGNGSVTSVGLSLPSMFTVSGSPVTESGTLTASLATQAANRALMGPTTGADAAPTFRAFVAADIPTLTLSKISDAGTAAAVNTGTSGGTVGLLNGNNTHSGANTFSASSIAFGATAGSHTATASTSGTGNFAQYVAAADTASIAVLQYGSTIGGTLYGLSRNNLSVLRSITSDNFLIGTASAAPISFVVSSTVRGNISTTGLNAMAIGATTPSTGAFTTLSASGAVIFNDAGADVDFRVEGDTVTNLFFVDASADMIGIGTSPGYRLDVLQGVGSANIFRAGQSGVSNGFTVTTDGSALSYSFVHATAFNISHIGAEAVVDVTAGVASSVTGNSKLILRTRNSGSAATYSRAEIVAESVGAGDTDLVFYTTTDSGGPVERMRILHSQGSMQLTGTIPQTRLTDTDGGDWYSVLNSNVFYMGPSASSTTAMLSFAADGTAVIVNEIGADCDFRVEGDTQPNLLLCDASADAVSVAGTFAISTGQVTNGSYTPTGVVIANMDSVTPGLAQYSRVGGFVTVSGLVTIDPTAAGSASCRLTLPVASNFTSTAHCGGVAAAIGVAGQVAGMYADTTNDQVILQFIAVDTTSKSMYYTYSYRIL